ncbi:MAG: hypothetical protein ABIF09_07970 [Gemmatimonadota bacterium]
MTDPTRGLFNPEVLNEKVMSAIIEFRTPLGQVGVVLDVLEQVAEGIDTVMAVGVAERCGYNGESVLEKILPEYGYPILRAKTNLGLGQVEVAS